MGRKTWESIPAKFRPLPGRKNIVLTRSPDALKETIPAEQDVDVVTDLAAALAAASADETIGHIFVIGGGTVYTQALTMKECDFVYLTRVFSEVECDVQMAPLDPAVFARPQDDVDAAERQEEKGIEFEFQYYKRI
eukprot:gene16004-33937_t